MIREFSESIGDAVLRRVGRAYGRVQERTPLQADVLESDDEYLIVVDAPGAAASDVQVKYADDRVLVRIDRFRDYHEGFEMRFPGRGLALDGEVDLPGDADVDPERANATLTDRGTLEIRVPKPDRADAAGASETGVTEDDDLADDAFAGDETDPGDLGEDEPSVTDETDGVPTDDEDADDA